MKTIYTLAIALMAGVILTACVGAVNIPSEVAEKVIKTTDPDPVAEKDTIVIVDDKEPEPKPEPIVISPEVALINRCIMDDNANDASCAPIVSDNPCITDPFGAACDITFADYYKTAQANRITFCSMTNNASDTFCESAIEKTPCIRNPFAGNCKTDFENYYQTARVNRIKLCNDNTEDSLCIGNDVAEICGYDPFSKVCGVSYHSPREIVCGNEPQSPRCTDTISRVCGDDVFHTLCDTHAIHEQPRINHCIMNDNAGNTNCKRVFAEDSCVINPFGAGCDTQVSARRMRESFCRESGNSTNPICIGAVLSLCDDDPFDRLCGESYQPKRDIIIADCIMIDNADKPKCESAVRDNYCIRYPFSYPLSSCRRIFTDYYQAARDNRKAYCNVADTAINGKSLCRNAVMEICNADPFDMACANGFDAERIERIKQCTSKDNTENNSLCANASLQIPCIRNPFANNCLTDFSDYYKSARQSRISFCSVNKIQNNFCSQFIIDCISDPFSGSCGSDIFNDSRNNHINFCILGSNNNDNICNNAVAAHPCITNPFANNCVVDFANYYQSARWQRQFFCGSGGNANQSLCSDAVKEDPCILTPFLESCEIDGRYMYGSRRIQFCGIHKNKNNDLCAVTLARVTGASWRQSFTTELVTHDQANANENGQNQFIISPNSHEVFLSIGGGGVSLRSGGQYRSPNYHYHVGFSSGIDLGAPRTETTGTATWDGRFRVYNAHGREISQLLTVKFGAGSQAGQIEAFVQETTNSTTYYYLTGDFNNSGVIAGKVNRGTFSNLADAQGNTNPNGQLTGLIGQKGAIGVFISDAIGDEGYAGGFVAQPPE